MVNSDRSMQALPVGDFLLVVVSLNDVDHVKEVALHRSRLVLGWVTVRLYTVMVCNQSLRSTQLPTLSGT